MRTHIIIPKELVEEVDRIVGRGHRSRFIEEALTEKVRRLHRAALARTLAGSLAEIDTPGWENAAAAAAWVQELRSQDALRLTRLRQGGV